MSKKLKEFLNHLIQAIYSRDEAAYRVALVGLFKSESGPEDIRRIIAQALNHVGDMEDSIDASLWVQNLDPLITKQESKAIAAKNKQQIQQCLVEAGYEVGIDFTVTPNGSIRLLSDEAKESLKNALPNHQWEWLLYSKILRV